jgi:uracil-DNA glycosylase family 4
VTVPSHRRLETLQAEIADCRACTRLVSWREQVAAEKRAAFRDEEYWGRPVPGFGNSDARLLVVGLAPAAHGANRTGRMFTGDRSGDWLYRALHRAGFASQPEAISRDDGLELSDAFVTSIVHCAPPDNKPTTRERDACAGWLRQELDHFGDAVVIVCLGGLAFNQVLRLQAEAGRPVPRPRPKFGHGVEVGLGDGNPHVIGSYHPSQQNTFTGRLTEPMLDQIFTRSRELIAG